MGYEPPLRKLTGLTTQPWTRVPSSAVHVSSSAGISDTSESQPSLKRVTFCSLEPSPGPT